MSNKINVNTDLLIDNAKQINYCIFRINAVKDKVKDFYKLNGLADFEKILKEDLLLKHISTLNACSRYLDNCAINFDKAENDISALINEV